MRTSKTIRNWILALGAAAVFQMGTAVVPAHALDVKELFKGEEATSSRVFKFYFSARKEGNEEDAVDVLKYAADQGNSAAQWKLGRMYQTGDGVEEDPLAAFNFFKKIADRYSDARPNTPNWQFSANALVALGNYYRDGIPGTEVMSDANQARVMYTTAAMVFRHPEAQFELGRMYIEQNDVRQGIRMLSLAEKKGHVGSQALIGNLLFEGVHLRRDPVRGLIMLTEAHERAVGQDKQWIGEMQEAAFALATEDERRGAMLLLGAKE